MTDLKECLLLNERYAMNHWIKIINRILLGCLLVSSLHAMDKQAFFYDNDPVSTIFKKSQQVKQLQQEVKTLERERAAIETLMNNQGEEEHWASNHKTRLDPLDQKIRAKMEAIDASIPEIMLLLDTSIQPQFATLISNSHPLPEDIQQFNNGYMMDMLYYMLTENLTRFLQLWNNDKVKIFYIKIFYREFISIMIKEVLIGLRDPAIVVRALQYIPRGQCYYSDDMGRLERQYVYPTSHQEWADKCSWFFCNQITECLKIILRNYPSTGEPTAEQLAVLSEAQRKFVQLYSKNYPLLGADYINKECLKGLDDVLLVHKNMAICISVKNKLIFLNEVPELVTDWSTCIQTITNYLTTYDGDEFKKYNPSAEGTHADWIEFISGPVKVSDQTVPPLASFSSSIWDTK